MVFQPGPMSSAAISAFFSWLSVSDGRAAAVVRFTDGVFVEVEAGVFVEAGRSVVGAAVAWAVGAGDAGVVAGPGPGGAPPHAPSTPTSATVTAMTAAPRAPPTIFASHPSGLPRR
ncbi:hypothetical protein GCM10009827_004940 [Dactylosporangium maewongense]|uniref:Uncharacterized protein n=1 Tax=Dactylosporangium maewongense TaxID=634393 RepID=A0ABN1ZK94_9ACTN